MVLFRGLFEVFCICVGTQAVMQWIWTESVGGEGR